MNNQPKYDIFEKFIQDKMNDYSNEYGKSWEEINTALNNSKNPSNKKPIIITLTTTLVVISLSSLLYLKSNNGNSIKSENIIELKDSTIHKSNNIILNNSIIDNGLNSKKIEKKKTQEKSRKNATKINIKENLPKALNEMDIDDKNIEEKLIIIDSNENNITPKLAVHKFKITSNKSIGCVNDSFFISSNSSINNNLKWIINDTFYSKETEIYFSPKYSGDYKVLLQQIKEDTLLFNTDSLTIQINKTPNIDFTYENTEDNGIISTYFTIKKDKNNQLKNSDFYWDFGDGKYYNDEFAVHHYLKNGNFLAILNYTSAEGCKQTIEKEIEITYNFDILAPNSFTPNGDGINDIFLPEGVKISGQPFEMSIYNKKGELIFITKNIQNPWNGFNQKNGIKCPNDNYLWVIKLQNEIGTIEYFKGTIQIIN